MWAVKGHYFTPFYNWPYTFGLLFGIGLYARVPRRSRALPRRLRRPALDGGHGRRGDAAPADSASTSATAISGPRASRSLGRHVDDYERLANARARGPRGICGCVGYWFVVVSRTFACVRCRGARDRAAFGRAHRGGAPAWILVGTAPRRRTGTSPRCRARPLRLASRSARSTSRTPCARLAERWDGDEVDRALDAQPDRRDLEPAHVGDVHEPDQLHRGRPVQHAGDATKTLIMRWNGKAWSILPSPNAPVPPVNALTGLACTGTTLCFAVGGYFVSTMDSCERAHAGRAVERHDAGRSCPARISRSRSTARSGRACTSTTNCFAVGNYDTQLVTSTLTERWDGKSWSIVSSPNPRAPPIQRAVGCHVHQPERIASRSVSAHSTLDRTMERHDRGGSSPSANPTGATGASLTGVSCPSATRCVAVGDQFRTTRCATARRDVERRRRGRSPGFRCRRAPRRAISAACRARRRRVASPSATSGSVRPDGRCSSATRDALRGVALASRPASRGCAGDVAAEIDAACRDTGFFYVVGHGVSAELAARVERLARAFFALPEAEKATIAHAARWSRVAGVVPGRRRAHLGCARSEGRPVLRRRARVRTIRACAPGFRCTAPNLFPRAIAGLP